MTFSSINPYTLETFAEYEVFDRKKIAGAFREAERAFSFWKNSPFRQRSECLRSAARLLREEKRRHAELITREMGKHVAEAEAEVEKCAALCDFYAENAERLLQPKAIQTERRNKIFYEPTGAVLGIMPWNFPYWQAFRFLTAAMTAGNAALLKHASIVCGCSLAMQDLLLRAGFPEGVFQSLIMDVKDVPFVVRHDLVQGVSLTGSELAGSKVAATAGRHIKKTVLELGGSDPVLVLDDADLPQAAKVATASRMINAGQSCICAKRFLVTPRSFDAFADRVLAEIKAIRQGDPLDPANSMGPMARLDLAEAIERQMRQSVEKGARLVQGGERSGCNFSPTLLLEAGEKMPIGKEETFGPLASVFQVKDEVEMIALANRSRFGLGASVWSKDLERAERVARQLQAGTVALNGMVKSDPRLPFGGVKKSGYGRELGEEGLKEFVNVKVVAG